MKKITLLLVFLFLSTVSFSQGIRNTIVNFGCSDKDDLSLLAGGRFHNRLYGALEYSHNESLVKNNELVCFGFGGKSAVVLAKAGACYEKVYDIPVTLHANPGQVFPSEMKTRFDYGVEWLWLADDINRVTFCYGISFTHMDGVQIKFGLAF